MGERTAMTLLHVIGTFLEYKQNYLQLPMTFVAFLGDNAALLGLLSSPAAGEHCVCDSSGAHGISHALFHSQS